MRERRKRQHTFPVGEAAVQEELAWWRKSGILKHWSREKRRELDCRIRQRAADGRYPRFFPSDDEVWHFYLRCRDVEGSLQEFLDFEDRAVETALPSLLETLRSRGGPGEKMTVNVGVLTMIADMLDPDRPGRWKLELRRNVRGAPSEHYGSFYHWIAMEYFELLEELKAEGARSPAKETTRRLIKRFEWTTNEIRMAVQWWRKHGLTLKR